MAGGVATATELVLAAVRSTLTAAAIPMGATVLLACSGGQDSSVLMHAMILQLKDGELGLNCGVAHFNHRLRGAESDQDELHVRWQAQRLGLPIVVGKPQSPLAGDEDSAREARLRFLAQTATDLRVKWIFTGHTLNDQAETVLLRLTRGTGLGGAGAMGALDPFPLADYRDKLWLVRPLLTVSRRATADYGRENDWPYVVDQTNSETTYARNRIRGEIMPALEGLNPAAAQAIARFATIARETDRFIEKLAADWLDQHAKTEAGLLSLPADRLGGIDIALQRAVVRLAIAKTKSSLKDVTLDQIEEVVSLLAGRDRSSANLSGDMRVVRRYGRLWFEPNRGSPATIPNLAIKVPGRAHLEIVDCEIVADILPAACGRPNDVCSHVDIPLGGPVSEVIVRGRRPGDRIRLAGVGVKKVQDVLVDAKVPRPLRDLVPLVLAEGRLVWIVGHAADLSGPDRIWLCLRRAGVSDCVPVVNDSHLGSVLITAEQIQARVRELGRQITDDYSGKEIVAVVVLKGAAIFAADLLRAIQAPVEVDYVEVASYGHDTVSSSYVTLRRDVSCDIEGRDALIVEDIVDTGLTLHYLMDRLAQRRPASLRVCTLLSKQKSRRFDVNTDYVGFEIPDRFVVGYGLDHAERYRNLAEIRVMG